MNHKEFVQREMFILHGIPFDELDVEMIPILEVLNFQLGIDTKYCCYGHKPEQKSYIMFGDEVEDSQMYSIVDAVDDLSNHRLKVFKWMRKTYKDDIVSNWILEIENYGELESKEKYHKKLLNKLKMIK